MECTFPENRMLCPITVKDVLSDISILLNINLVSASPIRSSSYVWYFTQATVRIGKLFHYVYLVNACVSAGVSFSLFLGLQPILFWMLDCPPTFLFTRTGDIKNELDVSVNLFHQTVTLSYQILSVYFLIRHCSCLLSSYSVD